MPDRNGSERRLRPVSSRDLPGGFSRQINRRLLAKAITLDVILQARGSHALTKLDGSDVRRVLHDLGHRQVTIGVVIVYFSLADIDSTVLTEDSLFGRRQALLKCGGNRDHLES